LAFATEVVVVEPHYTLAEFLFELLRPLKTPIWSEVVLAAVISPMRWAFSSIAAAVLYFPLQLEWLYWLVVGSLGLPCLMPGCLEWFERAGEVDACHLEGRVDCLVFYQNRSLPLHSSRWTIYFGASSNVSCQVLDRLKCCWSHLWYVS
jgi:hypothetical protein